MDSTVVTQVLPGAGYGTLEQLLILIVGTLAIPTAMWVKDKLHYFIRPEFITATIAIGSAFFLCHVVLNCGLAPKELIDLSLKTIGEASLVYGGARLYTEYKEKKKTVSTGEPTGPVGG